MIKTFFTFLTILVGLFALYLLIKIIAEIPEVSKNKKYFTASEMRQYLDIEKLKKKWFKYSYKQVVRFAKRNSNKATIYRKNVPENLTDKWARYIKDNFTRLGYNVEISPNYDWIHIYW